MPTPAPPAQSPTRDITLAALFFALSTGITWWFIKGGSSFYPSGERMLLSCGIAGGKWALQILAALLFLREKRWPFIRRLGVVCLAGSAVLILYCFQAGRAALGASGFLVLLMAAVALMIGLYRRAVKRTALHPRWFWGWMACLGLAVTLQLTVVFR